MSSPPRGLEIGAKACDYWWTVMAVDPLALPLTRMLARSGSVSPDQVTIASILLGLPTGLAFSTGTRAGLVVGALLFYFSFLLDCVDGKLARVLKTSSPRGKELDDLGDGARRSSASAGLAVFLWRTSSGGVFWLAVACGLLAQYYAQISGGTRGEPQTNMGGRWTRALRRRRLLPTPGLPDVAALVFVVGPLTGWVAPALAIGNLLFGLAILLTVYRLLRHPS